MAEQSVFEKKFVEKDTMNDVEGILEGFNLPISWISWIRRNVTAIKIVIAILVVLTIAYSAYVSYSRNLLKNSTDALALALTESDIAKQNTALQNVISEYSSTDAATMAMSTVAHNELNSGNFDSAADNYQAIIDKVGDGNPIYALALFGKASAYEGLGKFDESFTTFESLQKISGYSDMAQLGMARSWEARSDFQKAIMVYNDYLLTAGDGTNSMKNFVESKIVRLEAKTQSK